ncbi:sulfite exporter TauE/SafE family protein [Hydrotalea sp.]|uniref:sulfite exporter TauE/SafE family protein n=1 Tax=Hydrotalea sp. TaxID=2881279 RepID=UPI003D09AB34
MENLYLFILLALLAEIAGTVGGFGSSLFFVPIASYFLDFHSVLGITALFHVSSNLSKIAFFRKGVNVMLIIYLGIPAVLFVLAGAWLTQFIATKILEIFLSIFLIVVSLVFLYFNNIFVRPTKLNAITGGTLSGFIAGLVGTGGAIRALVFSAFQLKTEVFIATSAVVDLAIDASRSFVYWHNGFVHAHDLYLIPILLLVSIAGTFIGKKILQYVSESLFKKIVLFLILLTGVFTLFKLLY